MLVLKLLTFVSVFLVSFDYAAAVAIPGLSFGEPAINPEAHHVSESSLVAYQADVLALRCQNIYREMVEIQRNRKEGVSPQLIAMFGQFYQIHCDEYFQSNRPMYGPPSVQMITSTRNIPVYADMKVPSSINAKFNPYPSIPVYIRQILKQQLLMEQRFYKIQLPGTLPDYILPSVFNFGGVDFHHVVLTAESIIEKSIYDLREKDIRHFQNNIMYMDMADMIGTLWNLEYYHPKGYEHCIATKTRKEFRSDGSIYFTTNAMFLLNAGCISPIIGEYDPDYEGDQRFNHYLIPNLREFLDLIINGITYSGENHSAIYSLVSNAMLKLDSGIISPVEVVNMLPRICQSINPNFYIRVAIPARVWITLDGGMKPNSYINALNGLLLSKATGANPRTLPPVFNNGEYICHRDDLYLMESYMEMLFQFDQIAKNIRIITIPDIVIPYDDSFFSCFELKRMLQNGELAAPSTVANFYNLLREAKGAKGISGVTESLDVVRLDGRAFLAVVPKPLTISTVSNIFLNLFIDMNFGQTFLQQLEHYIRHGATPGLAEEFLRTNFVETPEVNYLAKLLTFPSADATNEYYDLALHDVYWKIRLNVR